MAGRDIQIAVAALLMGAAALARPLPAHAQFGGDCGVTPFDPCFVSDQSAETSLADIDTVQLPNILQQDSTTAASLTTPGGGGFYTPTASLISALDQQLFAQVNSQDASTVFPGFQPLPNYTLRRSRPYRPAPCRPTRPHWPRRSPRTRS